MGMVEIWSSLSSVSITKQLRLDGVESKGVCLIRSFVQCLVRNPLALV